MTHKGTLYTASGFHFVDDGLI